MSEAPTVWCLEEGKKVPIWYCLGSFTHKKKRCPHMIKMMVWGTENRAEVECGFEEDEEQEV